MNYLILPSNSIGGSEVRLVNNWVYSKQTGIESEVKLVVTKSLLTALSKRGKVYEELIRFSDDIVACSFPEDFEGIQNKLKSLIEKELTDVETAIILLHVPLRVKKKEKRNFIYIYPGNSFFIDSNVKGLIGQAMNIIKADRIDVLDPSVFAMLKRIFFFKRKAFYFTEFSINQYSLDLVSRINYTAKQNHLVFLGRFIAIKQVIEFLDCIHEMWKAITLAGVHNPKIIVIGQGPLEAEVCRRVISLQKQGIAIEQLKTENPFDILFQSKIYFSLQKHNNYPSQSLIESILSGCIPVVTNSGSSEKLLSPGATYLVNEKLDAKEIANHCVSILSLSNKEFQERSTDMIHYLTSKYAPQKMAEYYHELLCFSN